MSTTTKEAHNHTQEAHFVFDKPLFLPQLCFKKELSHILCHISLSS